MPVLLPAELLGSHRIRTTTPSRTLQYKLDGAYLVDCPEASVGLDQDYTV